MVGLQKIHKLDDLPGGVPTRHEKTPSYDPVTKVTAAADATGKIQGRQAAR